MECPVSSVALSPDANHKPPTALRKQEMQERTLLLIDQLATYSSVNRVPLSRHGSWIGSTQTPIPIPSRLGMALRIEEEEEEDGGGGDGDGGSGRRKLSSVGNELTFDRTSLATLWCSLQSNPGGVLDVVFP
jgi:hypothetical protein